jgi:drug/metabolite transporter (DMT)-like permease
MACSMVTLRKLSKTEPTERILFYFFVGNLILGFFPMLYSWKNFENPMMWFYVAMVGVGAFCFQFLITKAYTYTTPTKVSPIAYFAIVFSGLFGWIFWGNMPDLLAFLGTFLIISGGLVVVRSDRKVMTEKLVRD